MCSPYGDRITCIAWLPSFLQHLSFLLVVMMTCYMLVLVVLIGRRWPCLFWIRPPFVDLLVLIWNLWNERNNVVLRGRWTAPHMILDRVKGFEFIIWLIHQFFRCMGGYMDASLWTGSKGKCWWVGIGVVIRDSDGQATSAVGCGESLWTEARAITVGLNSSHSMGFRVESGSAIIVTNLRFSMLDLSSLGHMFHEAQTTKTFYFYLLINFYLELI